MAKKKSVKKKSVKKSSSNKDLTIHFMPYSEIVHEDALGRVKKIMGLDLARKIIILQGRLKPDEEVRLIENSMTLIGNIKGFQGIEIAAISGEADDRGLFDKVRHNIAKILWFKVLEPIINILCLLGFHNLVLNINGTLCPKGNSYSITWSGIYGNFTLSISNIN